MNLIYFKLHNDFGLCGWEGKPYAIRHFPSGEVKQIGEESFYALSFCDGNFNGDSLFIPQICKEIIDIGVAAGVVNICEMGEKLEERQKYILHPCRSIHSAHWSITGKCNMYCRHCFMSAPQERYGEISTETAMDIINQLATAGISKINLTGGEPLVRKDFWKIVDRLREENIVIHQIYTNGLLVDNSLLDQFEKRNMKPEFSLSFDGVGWHDWLRDYKGAEEIAVSAIKLLCSRGFPVSVESAFHRDSIGTMSDTMQLLAELGVFAWKTNPVASSGNWLSEDRNLDMTMDELYNAYLLLIPEYLASGSPLTIQLGGFFSCGKGSNEYVLPSKKYYANETELASAPLCMSARSQVYISADARLLPCMPLTGISAQDEYPSLCETTITEAMNDSLYLQRITATNAEFYEHNVDCAACVHKRHCNGGCRAAALSENNGTDYFGVDRWTCFFFKGGYEEKIKAVVGKNGQCQQD